MLLVFVLIVALSCIALNAKSPIYRSDVYPSNVPKYEVRLDVHTNKPVMSGLVHTLPPRSSLVEFRRHMQCSSREPNLNYNNGMISRMRLAPPTSFHYKVFCSFAESRCVDQWGVCQNHISKLESGDYRQEGFNALSGWSVTELLRVVNSTLHYDWPWGIERIANKCPVNPLSSLINATLSRITDMRDSAFFTGGADPALRMNVQIPFFAHCTHENFADIVVPWFNMWVASLEDYRKARKFNSEESYRELELGYKPWIEKVPKAALFTSAMNHRVFMYDQARLRPDLIDSINIYELTSFCFVAWNPESTEECWGEGINRTKPSWPTPEQVTEYMKLPPGFIAPLFNVTSPHYAAYHPGSYKYVVIPLGRQSLLSTSARIMHIMFYSGAVAIMPRTSWIFHVQAQLKPWVHYVPISFTGADLAEKVQWLNEHDDLAQQIAENGRNFARSYLRLEDFYCYTANWLDLMAEINSMTDAANVTFSPKLYPEVCERDRPDVYFFPE